MPKERYIPSEKRQPVFDAHRLIYYIHRMIHQKIKNVLDNSTEQPF